MAFLKWEDYLTLVITTILTMVVGLYFARKGKSQNTTTQFIHGDGKMAVCPVALSMTVSTLSGITMLGLPTEVYMYGMQWYLTLIGWFISDILSTYVFIPSLKMLDVTSVYEYLQRRYTSPGIRVVAVVFGMFQGLNYLGTVLFIPAISLQGVTNIPLWLSITGLMALIVTYTFIGGFKAVVWSDAFQAILMFSGALAVLVKGTHDAGGVTSVVTAAYDNGRANFFIFDPDPTLRQSFWSLVFGSSFSFSSLFTQMSFLRIKATSTVRKAQRMYLLASFITYFLTTLVILQGAVMFAFYDNSGCDPIVSKAVSNPNQLIVEMVARLFKDSPCLPGLFLAAIFSASLSTVSSILSAMSAMFWEDIVKPHTKPMSEKRGLIITKLSVLMFGVTGTGIAFVVSTFQGPVFQIFETVHSCLSAAVVGVFLLGWFDPIANKKGAVVGALASVLVLGWISFGKITSSGLRITPPLEPASTERCIFPNSSYTLNSKLDESISNISLQMNHTVTKASPEPQGLDLLYSVSYKWLSAIGILTSVITGAVVSRLQAPEPADSSLVIPLCDLFCCCFPESLKAKFRCGVSYSEVQKDAPDDAVENVMVTEVPINDEFHHRGDGHVSSTHRL